MPETPLLMYSLFIAVPHGSHYFLQYRLHALLTAEITPQHIDQPYTRVLTAGEVRKQQV